LFAQQLEAEDKQDRRDDVSPLDENWHAVLTSSWS
jgi:hypothetical protein